MNEPQLVVTGNLTRTPETRHTTGGRAVTNLRIAVTPRRRDPDTGTWSDGVATYLDAEVWGGLGENVAESMSKGDQVLIVGRLRTDRWTPDSGPDAGTEQTRLRVVVDDIGPSLRFATAKPVRTGRREDAPPTEGAPF